MAEKFAFIINPNAGKKKKINIREFIEQKIPANIDYRIFEWEIPHQFDAIEKEIFSASYSCVVACGGDGTVNKVARSVMNSSTNLGILPFGSGNGLARTMGISLHPEKALQQVVKGNETIIDSGKVNDQSFFCTAGTGFDAQIGLLFASSKKRGYFTYAKISAEQLLRYQSQPYTISIDGKTIQREAFLITACNAGQWGNDVFIAPEAKINDGLLHLSVVRSFGIHALPSLAYRLFSKKIHHSPYVETFSGKSIRIERENEGPIHFDGEPMQEGKLLHIEINPQSLKIRC